MKAQDQSTTAPESPGDARVIIVHDADATLKLQPVALVVEGMVQRAITNLTGQASPKAAWLSLVSTNDTVGIKVFSHPGAYSGTRPAVVAAVVQGLLSAGVPPKQIIVWDKRALDLRLAGFFEMESRFGIRVAGAMDAGWDESTNYESTVLGTPRWGDLEFGKTGDGIGRKSYVSKLVSHDITRIINIVPLMHHNQAGVSGNLYSLALGSVDNTFRFESSSASMAQAIPEIYALPVLGDRVILNLVDSLICQYEGEQTGLLHYSAVLNELRFSRDAVALDVLSIEEIERQRKLAGAAVIKFDSTLYSNAALLGDGINDTHHINVLRIQ